MVANIVWRGAARARLLEIAQSEAPREMAAVLGGQLVGDTAHIDRVLELPNHATCDDRFEVPAVAFAQCEHSLRQTGRHFLGFAHSHPGGSVGPSQQDRQRLWTGCLQVITDGWQCRAFMLNEKRAVMPVQTIPTEDRPDRAALASSGQVRTGATQ